MVEVIAKSIISKLVSNAFDSCNKIIKGLSSPKELQVDSVEAIAKHLNFVENWSKELSFKDANVPKKTTYIYIKLGFYLNRKSSNLSQHNDIRISKSGVIKTLYRDITEKLETNNIDPSEISHSRETDIDIAKIVESTQNHLVILGQPGAGKTTSMKYISQLLIWDNIFCSEKFSFPIVIRLRELGDTTLIEHLIIHLRITDIQTDKYKNSMSCEFERIELVSSFLEELKAVVIFDGLDEVNGNDAITRTAKTISNINLRLRNTLTITTCRTADFSLHIDNSVVYELKSLSLDEIRRFSKKWIRDSTKSTEFIDSILSSPFYDIAMRPLMIAHLCAIYEREHLIPEKPKTVYKLTIEILLKEWDLQRGLKRNTAYSGFEVDRKFDFLTRLSFELVKSGYKLVFNESELLRVYEKIRRSFNLPQYQALDVIREVESHSGLFIQSSFDTYEFAHKSIQEYLIAECLIKMPSYSKFNSIIESLPNELAICVSLSSYPSEYFTHIVFTYLNASNINYKFTMIFMERIRLEKPDFEVTLELGFALAYLCHEKSLNHYFSEISSNPVFKESLKLIQSYYRLERRHSTTVNQYRKTRHISDKLINSFLDQQIMISISNL